MTSAMVANRTLPEDWKWSKLERVCSGIFDCPHSTPALTLEGPLLVRSQDIRSGVLRAEEAAHVSEETYRERVRRAKPVIGDLLFSREGTYFGIAAEVPADTRLCLGQRMVLIRPDPKSLSFRFLRHWLNSPAAAEHVYARRDGSVAERLNVSTIRTLPLPIPPLEQQNAIAKILGDFDEKLQINRQMNQTLEAIARAIFKSWFVDFDAVSGGQPLFSRAFDSSPLGQIPKDWKVGTLGDVAENPRRGVAPADVSPETAYIGLEHMPRRSIALDQWGEAEGLESNKFRFFRGEILFGKLRPYFHKVGVAAVDGICSTDILVVVPLQDAYFGFVLALVSSEEFVQYADRGSAGTKMPRTNWSDMARYRAAIPPEPVAGAFTEIVKPMIERIAANIHESRTLAALRDALLPKLLSGEIRVKQAEKIVGEAV